MKRMLLWTPIVLGGVFVARHLLTPDRRDSLSRALATKMKHCMEQMPEDFPPKVVTSGVRRIQTQNDEILTLVREQNKLLRRAQPPRMKTVPRTRRSAQERREPTSE